MRLADANGDGRPDIVTGWEEGGRVRLYLNPGPAAAKAPWPAVTVGEAGSVEDAVLVDLDGDGALDVVSCSEGSTRRISVHWAPRERPASLDPAAWKTEPLPPSQGMMQWMYCLPMQVDGRNGIDLVAGGKNRGAALGWWEAPANPRDFAGWRWHRPASGGLDDVPRRRGHGRRRRPGHPGDRTAKGQRPAASGWSTPAEGARSRNAGASTRSAGRAAR